MMLWRKCVYMFSDGKGIYSLFIFRVLEPQNKIVNVPISCWWIMLFLFIHGEMRHSKAKWILGKHPRSTWQKLENKQLFSVLVICFVHNGSPSLKLEGFSCLGNEEVKHCERHLNSNVVPASWKRNATICIFWNVNKFEQFTKIIRWNGGKEEPEDKKLREWKKEISVKKQNCCYCIAIISSLSEGFVNSI